MDGGHGSQTLGQARCYPQHHQTQIYTVSASFDPNMPQAAHVVRLRAGFDRKEFVSATSDVLKLAVRGELEQLFSRATA